MMKKIISVFIAALVLCSTAVTGLCATVNPEAAPIYVKSVKYEKANGKIELVIANKSKNDIGNFVAVLASEDKNVEINTESIQNYLYSGFGELAAGAEKTITYPAKIKNFDGKKYPDVICEISYIVVEENIDLTKAQEDVSTVTYKNIFNSKTAFLTKIKSLLAKTGGFFVNYSGILIFTAILVIILFIIFFFVLKSFVEKAIKKEQNSCCVQEEIGEQPEFEEPFEAEETVETEQNEELPENEENTENTEN